MIAYSATIGHTSPRPGASYQRAQEQGRPLRLVLRIRPPELARLPWEFLYDAGQGDYLGLSLLMVRSPQVLEPQRGLPVAPPLRILAMVARPGDREALEVAREQERMRMALGGLEAGRLPSRQRPFRRAPW